MSQENKLAKVITDAQDILATYIVPDSGISDHECINRLLGLLDGPQTREALAAPSAIDTIAVPRDTLEGWRLALSQGDGTPRWEIAELLGRKHG